MEEMGGPAARFPLTRAPSGNLVLPIDAVWGCRVPPPSVVPV